MIDTSYHRSEYLQHAARSLVLPEEWKGQAPNRFTTNKRHVMEPLVLDPEGSRVERRHFGPQPLSPSFEWRPSLRMVGPVDHSGDREIGTTKVIKHLTVVKQRVDRVPKFKADSAPPTLADFISQGRTFLQKYNGVRTLQLEAQAHEKHRAERLKRTQYPTIDPYACTSTDHLADYFAKTTKNHTLMFK